MQDALPQIAPISLKQALRRRTCFLPVFAHAFIPGYVRISFFDVALAEHEADIGDFFSVLVREIIFPAKGDIASLDDHVLAVL